MIGQRLCRELSLREMHRKGGVNTQISSVCVCVAQEAISLAARGQTVVEPPVLVNR